MFLRSDDQIARDVRQDVLRRAMWIDPDTVAVEVCDGVVTLTGQLERRSLTSIAVGLAHDVDGVVDVVDRLSFELDDTSIMVPSDLLIDRSAAVRRRIEPLTAPTVEARRPARRRRATALRASSAANSSTGAASTGSHWVTGRWPNSPR